jgi:hypothetical protein
MDPALWAATEFLAHPIKPQRRDEHTGFRFGVLSAFIASLWFNKPCHPEFAQLEKKFCA